ncbi:Integrin, alpha [Cichlidogyrus casuarinus]|uniref:Integrin, alpha n=1 Tax=Cichlidogyrus casuarinus TaxID=1844966 RepID=A0ABD2PWJ4_9PLAT
MGPNGVRSRTRRSIETKQDGESNDPLNVVGNDNESADDASYREIFRNIPREFFKCDREGMRFEKPFCAIFTCKVPKLARNEPVELIFESWLWARTFFKHHISDLIIATDVEVSQGTLPEGVVPVPEPAAHYMLFQTVVFPEIRPKTLHMIPIWPIILGVVVGLLILSALIAVLYRCGFFRRKSKDYMRKAALQSARAEEVHRRMLLEEGVKMAPKRPSTVLEHWERNPLEKAQYEAQIQEEELATLKSGESISNMSELRDGGPDRRESLMGEQLEQVPEENESLLPKEQSPVP